MVSWSLESMPPSRARERRPCRDTPGRGTEWPSPLGPPARSGVGLGGGGGGGLTVRRDRGLPTHEVPRKWYAISPPTFSKRLGTTAGGIPITLVTLVKCS